MRGDLRDRASLEAALESVATVITTAHSLDRLMAGRSAVSIAGIAGEGNRNLVTLAAALPESPFLYPEDQAADLPLRLLAAEVTREQVFLQLHQELPYEAAVETEKWEDRPDGSTRIEQTIHVQREGQRAIVLGKGGAKIKQIVPEYAIALARVVAMGPEQNTAADTNCGPLPLESPR